MRIGVVVTLLVVAMLAGAGAGYFIGVNSTPNTSTRSSTTAAQASTQSTTSVTVEGLQLEVALNSSTIRLGQRLGIEVSLNNTISSLLNLSSSSAWKVGGFPIAMWPGCYFTQAVEFMIVKGNYNLSALQTASNSSEWFPSNFVGCAEGGTIEHIVFQPTSVRANLSGTMCVAICTPRQSFGADDLASNFTVNGYWTYPFNSSEAWDVLTPIKPCPPPSYCSPAVTFNFPEESPIPQHLFTSGLYTLVVDDEWGQAVILHFTVT